MLKIGYILNIFALIIIISIISFWGAYLFQIDFNKFPNWAIAKN